MAGKNENRVKVKLRSSEGTGYTYITTKNRANQRERITLKKYDPIVRKHVEFKEEK